MCSDGSWDKRCVEGGRCVGDGIWDKRCVVGGRCVGDGSWDKRCVEGGLLCIVRCGQWWWWLCCSGGGEVAGPRGPHHPPLSGHQVQGGVLEGAPPRPVRRSVIAPVFCHNRPWCCHSLRHPVSSLVLVVSLSSLSVCLSACLPPSCLLHTIRLWCCHSLCHVVSVVSVCLLVCLSPSLLSRFYIQ